MRISVVKAKANLSRLLAEVEAGREVVITRRGAAVARLSCARAIVSTRSRFESHAAMDREPVRRVAIHQRVDIDGIFQRARQQGADKTNTARSGA